MRGSLTHWKRESHLTFAYDTVADSMLAASLARPSQTSVPELAPDRRGLKIIRIGSAAGRSPSHKLWVLSVAAQGATLAVQAYSDGGPYDSVACNLRTTVL